MPEGEQGERAGWDDEDVEAWVEGDVAGYVFGGVSWRGVAALSQGKRMIRVGGVGAVGLDGW